MNVCIVRCCENNVLLVKNRKRDGWEFPGGKIDFQNDAIIPGIIDIEAVARREYLEETEQPVFDLGKPDRQFYNPGTKTFFLIYYVTEPFQEKIIKNDKSIVAAKDWNTNNLPKMAFKEDIKIILQNGKD